MLATIKNINFIVRPNFYHFCNMSSKIKNHDVLDKSVFIALYLFPPLSIYTCVYVMLE